jgi:hypothetical protein
MKQQIVYIVGNPAVRRDNVPFRILPQLRRVFPSVDFREADPNENFVPEEGSIIIDSVEGIDAVQSFDSLDDFAAHHTVSGHDYDLAFHLRVLQKLHKINSVTILGVPVRGTDKIIHEVRKALALLLS